MAKYSADWTEIGFVKSSYSKSDGGQCVEIGVSGAIIGVRDSKLGTSSPVLELSRDNFARLRAVAASSDKYPDAFSGDYLADLRDDWPT